MLYSSLFEVLVLFWWARAWGNSRRAALAARWTGGQSARSRHGCVFRLEQRVCTEQYSVWAPLQASGSAGLWHCDLAWSPPGHHHHRANVPDRPSQIHLFGKAVGNNRSPSWVLCQIPLNPLQVLVQKIPVWVRTTIRKCFLKAEKNVGQINWQQTKKHCNQYSRSLPASPASIYTCQHWGSKWADIWQTWLCKSTCLTT